MPTVRELVTKLDVRGNSAEKLAAFGLAMNGVKAGLDLMVSAFNGAKAVIFDFTAEIAGGGDEIAKAAKNIGVTAEELQELKFAAEISGAGMKDVQTAIQRMGKGMNDAIRTGTGPFADALAQMGVRMEEFDGLNPVERFEKLSTALKGVKDSSEQAALAQDLFGRGGKTLIPLLETGGAGIRALREEAIELGLAYSNETAAASEEFIDSQLRLKTVLTNIKNAVGAELMPVIQGVIDTTRKWFSANRELIKGKLTGFVKTAIVWLKKLKPAFSSVVRVVKDMVPIFKKWFDIVAKIIAEDLELFLTNTMARFEEMKPTLIELWEVFKSTVVTIGKFIHDLAELIQSVGGLTRVLKMATAGWVAFKIATIAALGPFGLIAAAFVLLLPIALELGDAIGEMVFGLTDMGKEADALTARHGGVTKSRNADVQVLRGLTGSSRGGLQQLQDRIRGKGGEELLRGLEKQSDTFGGEARKFLEGERRLKKSERKFETEQARTTRKEEARIAKIQAVKDGAARRKKIADDAEIAKQRAADEKKARRARLGLDEKDDKITDKELLVLIQKAGATGQSLTGLIGGRGLATTGPPPVITVTVTNNNIDMQVDAPVTVNGASSEIAEDIARMVSEETREVLSEEFRGALEELQPVEAR